MPPRRSARVAAGGERAVSAPVFAALPHALALHVLALLPADARARASLVCRAWAAALAEPDAWLRLDLSPESGVTIEATQDVLRAAAARAGGRLEALSVRAYRRGFNSSEVVAANTGTLRELRLRNPGRLIDGAALPAEVKAWCCRLEEVEQHLRAAPLLRLFECAVQCSCEDASRVLCNEPPFGPLRVRALALERGRDGLPMAERAPDEAAVLAAIAGLSRHPWLREIALNSIPLTPAALHALVHAAPARHLTSVSLYGCHVGAGAAPALARLLAGGCVEQLHVDDRLPLDVPGALLLGNALRTSTRLVSLQFRVASLWDDPAVGRLLLTLLTGHPSLRQLDFSLTYWGDMGASAGVGFALAALVAANAPALRHLNVTACGLGDAGLLPLVAALPHNTHLSTLQCGLNDILEAPLTHERLPSALQANASLRELELVNDDEPHIVDAVYPEFLYELQDMVAARGAAAATP
jgi:hypothetical protein